MSRHTKPRRSRAGNPCLARPGNFNLFEPLEPRLLMSGDSPNLPDLVVGNVQVISFRGDSILFGCTISNIGDASADLNGPSGTDPFAVAAYLSPDSQGTSEVLLGTGEALGAAPLAPGSSQTMFFRLQGAVDVTTHPFLIVSADSTDVVAESSELNNDSVATAIAPSFSPAVTLSVDDTPILDDQDTPVDFGVVVSDTSGETKTFTITNLSGAALTTSFTDVVSDVPMAVVGDFPSTLAPYGSATFTVTATSSETGTHSGDVLLAFAELPDSIFNFPITATLESAPEIAVSRGDTGVPDGQSTPIDFGSVTQGDAAPRITFTVRNDGDEALSLGDLSLPDGFSLYGDPLPDSLDGHTSASFTVQLDSDTVGSSSGDVSLTNGDSNNNPFTFAVAGEVTAVPAPVLQVSDGNQVLDNGADDQLVDAIQQGASPWVWTFTIKNTGTADLVPGTVSVSDTDNFSVTQPLQTTLAPGYSTTFTVTMNTDNVGSQSALVSFDSNDPDQTEFDLTVGGFVAYADPTAVVTDGSGSPITSGQTAVVGFGSITEGSGPAQFSFTVLNEGMLPLTLGNVSVPDGFSVASDLAGSLNAGDSTTFTVQLDDTTPGAKSGEISFATNDPASPFVFSVAGEVTAASTTGIEVTLDGNSLTSGDTTPIDFGSVNVGATSPELTFTITNTGEDRLSIDRVSVYGSTAFGVMQQPKDGLLAGASTTFQVAMFTDSAGTGSGEIRFTYGDGSTFSFFVSGEVTAVPAPDLVVLPATPASYSVTPGQSFSLPIDIQNTGDAAAAGAASPITVALHMSSVSDVTADDPVVGSFTLTSLSAGESTSGTVTFNVPTQAGVYYLSAVVDSGGVVAESDESNNWGDTVMLLVVGDTFDTSGYFPLSPGSTWQYDVNQGDGVQRRSIAPTPVVINGVSTQEMQIENTDGVHVSSQYYGWGASGLGFYQQSWTPDPETGDAGSVESYAPAQAWLPASGQLGTVYTTSGSMSGTASDGTAWTGTFTHEVRFAGVESVTVPLGTYTALRIEVLDTLTKSAGLWGETDEGDSTLWLVEGLGMAKSSESWSYENLYNGAVESSDLDVNGYELTSAGTEADLTGSISSVTIPDAFLGGQPGQASVLIQNIGGKPAKNYYVDVYASLDGTLDSGDILVGHKLVKTSVGADSSTTQTVSLDGRSASLEPRKYYFIAQINPTGAVVESSTTNNTAVTDDPTQLSWIFGTSYHKRSALNVAYGDGATATFSLSGKGYGLFQYGEADEWNIIFRNTGTSSTATLTTTGGHVSLNDVSIESPLKALKAGTADLVGDLTAQGQLGSLALGNVTSGSSLDILKKSNGVNLTFGHVADLLLSSVAPITSLTATDWLSPTADSNEIEAPWIGKIAVTGDFDPNLSLSGNLTGKPTLGNDKAGVVIGGSVNHAAWDVPGTAGTIVVGWLNNSQINALGSIDSFSAVGLVNSTVFAGVMTTRDTNGDGVWDLPDPDTDFRNPITGANVPAEIKRVTIVGLATVAAGGGSGTGGGTPSNPLPDYCLVNSNIASNRLGTITIGYAKTDNSGVPFGLAACGIGRVTYVSGPLVSVTWNGSEIPPVISQNLLAHQVMVDVNSFTSQEIVFQDIIGDGPKGADIKDVYLRVTNDMLYIGISLVQPLAAGINVDVKLDTEDGSLLSPPYAAGADYSIDMFSGDSIGTRLYTGNWELVSGSGATNTKTQAGVMIAVPLSSFTGADYFHVLEVNLVNAAGVVVDCVPNWVPS